MRNNIDRALDLWDFELARVLLASSEYKEEYENFLYETGQFSYLQNSIYTNKITKIEQNLENFEGEGIEAMACVNYMLNNAIAKNDLCVQRAYDLFHKIKFEKFLLAKAYFISKIISYFATKSESDRIEFFVPLAMYSSPQNLLMQVLQKDFNDQKGAKKFFDDFIFQASLLVRKNLTDRFLGSKVAICFHGIFRGDFEGQINDTLEKLAKPLNADVFIFTWDKFQEWGGLCGGISWSDRLLEKKLAESAPAEIGLNENFRKFFPNTSKVLSYEYRTPLSHKAMQKFIAKNPCIRAYALENQDHKYLVWGEKIYYGMQKSLDLMQEYENKHNIRYDFIIFARPDFEIIKTISLEDLRELDLNEICEEYGFYGSGSAFPYGRAEAMRHYVSLMSNLHHLQGSYLTNVADNHDTQSKWAMYFNLKTRDWKHITALYNRYAPSDIICLKKLRIPNIKKAFKEDLVVLQKEFDEEKLKEFESFFDRFTSHYECVSKKAKRYVANESATEAKAKSRKIFSKIWKFIRG